MLRSSYRSTQTNLTLNQTYFRSWSKWLATPQANLWNVIVWVYMILPLLLTGIDGDRNSYLNGRNILRTQTVISNRLIVMILKFQICNDLFTCSWQASVSLAWHMKLGTLGMLSWYCQLSCNITYLQGKGILKLSKGFCSLNVLCSVHGIVHFAVVVSELVLSRLYWDFEVWQGFLLRKRSMQWPWCGSLICSALVYYAIWFSVFLS